MWIAEPYLETCRQVARCAGWRLAANTPAKGVVING
jgi:hypothetical protein